MSKDHSYPKGKIKIVLVENIHDAAYALLKDSGYAVEMVGKALEGEDLNKVIADAHVIGVRSRTKIRQENLAHAKRLMVIGCFSVGTDPVALDAATVLGIPVFNAPHSSTRSVAELTMGNIITLARRTGDKNIKLHRNEWDKNLAGAHEVRGKCLGIVGYGHIGQQVGLLADAFGMDVVFFDLIKKLPLGRARSAKSLDALLEQSHYVSLHVPGTPKTKGMIGEKQLSKMKKGAHLLNLSRGAVVDLESLREALASGHLGGAALDVFPEEPTSVVAPFDVGLTEFSNVILTPHIGGTTEEAQKNIGLEVAQSFINFIDRGITEGAVNFPAINLPQFPHSHRILNIHRNVPGALAQLTQIVSDVGANIDAQHLSTYKEIGYLIMDINKELSEEVKTKISALPISIKTRILY